MFRIFGYLRSPHRHQPNNPTTRRQHCRLEVEALEGRVVLSFAPVGPFPVGDFPNSVATGDFNGDGRLDLATANFRSNTVSIRLGDGGGGFALASDVATGSSPVTVAVGDFNRDGKPDLAIANLDGGTVSIRLGDGAGNFSGSTNIPVGTYPQPLALGDFNGDGWLDLAVGINVGGVKIRLNDGAGGWLSNLPDASGYAGYLAAEDFNGDGKLDLAYTEDANNAVRIHLGNGAGGFGSPMSIPIGGGPYPMAWGDFN